MQIETPQSRTAEDPPSGLKGNDADRSSASFAHDFLLDLTTRLDPGPLRQLVAEIFTRFRGCHDPVLEFWNRLESAAARAASCFLLRHTQRLNSSAERTIDVDVLTPQSCCVSSAVAPAAEGSLP